MGGWVIVSKRNPQIIRKNQYVEEGGQYHCSCVSRHAFKTLVTRSCDVANNGFVDRNLFLKSNRARIGSAQVII